MTAEKIAQALGGKRSGRQWKCKCPAHDDHDPSMIVFDGRDAVQVRCLSGCDPRDIIAALKARGIWDSRQTDQPVVSNFVEEINRNQERALRIWDEAVNPRLTPAELYLLGRDLTLPKSSAIRFHRGCPHERSTAPALVALMCDVLTGEPRAIQRLFLDRANRKVDAKMLGPAGGAAMMLTSWADTFSDCLSFCPRLFVCEGLETAIALNLAGYGPTWALGSAGAIARLPVLFGVGELVICADHDRNCTGLSAALDCRVRYAEARRPARIWMPREQDRDFADQIGGTHGGQSATA
jgi:hypothetical protein